MKLASALIIARLTFSKANDACMQCRVAAPCFQEGCANFDIDKKEWSGVFIGCNGDGNGNGSAGDCYEACYPDACNPICKACSDNDLTAVGVSDECFTAVGEYEDSLSEEPDYTKDCDHYAVASNVTVMCQEAVSEYHDCGGSYNYAPVCTACDKEDPEGGVISADCYNALSSFKPSGEPEYEETCGDLNDATDVSIKCMEAVGEYFGPLCGGDESGDSGDGSVHDSVCDACKSDDPEVVGVSEDCFTAVGRYSKSLSKEPPYASKCGKIESASVVPAVCQGSIFEYHGCASNKVTAICKECASEDINTEGIGDDCYTALRNYEPPDNEFPPYASKCGEPESASVVTAVCQAAVFDNFDCLVPATTESPTESPTTSQSSAITVPGAAVTLITMAAMVA